eukprot:NODE_102_length_20354_cov_0.272018.p1 type:complete len:628 gc:universal NODE_102_length_20354_cov_0.272018:2583-4466(+)
MTEKTDTSECPKSCDCNVSIAPVDYSFDIPVFKPNFQQFKHFKKLMEFLDNHYGQFYGLVKVIPPDEYYDKLEDPVEKLKDIKIKHPIAQQVLGKSGLYTIMNLEDTIEYTVKEWLDISFSERSKPPYYNSTETISGNLAESLSSYHKKLNSLDVSLLENKPYTSLDLDEQLLLDLEKQFWQTIAFHPGMYGADLSGSLMNNSDLKYWNLNSLPDLLNKLESTIPGVNTPYLYFGMWKAVFAWHLEDCDLYSINYLHLGSPKFWYVIPPSELKKFEAICQQLFGQEHRNCREFMRHKKHLMSPTILNKHNIKYFKTVQNSGEFMITFPYAYHAGFNLGFNCAEATNFALERWAQSIGEYAKACTCINDSVVLDVNLFKNKPLAPRRIRLRLMNEIELLLEDKEEFEELENVKIVCQICQRCDKDVCPVILFVNYDKTIGYAHIVCAMFTKDVDLIINEEEISKLAKRKRFRQAPLNLWGFEHFVYSILKDDTDFVAVNECSLCRRFIDKPNGITVKCQSAKCQTWMHAICAFERGNLCYRSMVESNAFLKELQNLPVSDGEKKGLIMSLDMQQWYIDACRLEQNLSIFDCYCRKHGVVVIYSNIGSEIYQEAKYNCVEAVQTVQNRK